MEGKDLIARARTGSGKTLAFSLPIIEKILAERGINPTGRGRRPQCIVLAPTRELAGQVHREITASAPTLTVGCYYGGSPYPPMERQLRMGVDIVVGTPGRIIDLIDRNALDLSEVRGVQHACRGAARCLVLIPFHAASFSSCACILTCFSTHSTAQVCRA